MSDEKKNDNKIEKNNKILEIDRLFLKRIKHLDKAEQEVLLALYKEIIA